MWKSKTVYAALAACITALGGFMAQELTMPEMAQVCITSILAIFLRHGVSKTKETAEAAVEAASSITPTPKKKVVKKAS
jgi:hydrogenase/urease accessory protein HupE